MDGVIKEGSLGSILFKSQIISEEDIVAALKEQQQTGCRFGEALVRQGIVTQEDIDWALANQLNIPYVRLKKEAIDRNAVSLVSAEMARQYNLMPIVRVGDELSVAFADPLNRTAIEAVERVAGLTVAVSIALMRELREMQDYFYGPDLATPTLGMVSQVFTDQALTAINSDLTGGKMVDYLLLYLVQNNMGSLSLQPLGERVAIVVRRGGKSTEIGSLGVTYYPDLVMKLRRLGKVAGSVEMAAHGMLAFRYKGKNILFQLLMLRGVGGELITIKPHVAAEFPASLGALISDPVQFGAVGQMLAAPSGLLLFAMRDPGDRCRLLDLVIDSLPTAGQSAVLVGESLGHGKKQLPRVPCHEVAHDQLHKVISAVMEHEPDLLVVEEVSDSRAFVAASKGALHGTLVVAGVPYHDTAATFRHLVQFRQRHYFLAQELLGVVLARGVLLLCPHCKVPYVPTTEERLALHLADEPSSYYRAEGCEACNLSGYAGKKFLVEVIPSTRELSAVLERASDQYEVLTYLRGQGQVGIEDQARQLLVDGEISPAEYVASVVL